MAHKFHEQDRTENTASGKFMKSICAIALTIAAASPAAAIINAPVPTAAYISFGGLHWAWASPCDASGPASCGAIDLAYQGTQGWRVAEAADFANSPTAADFLFAGANVPAGGTEAGTGATFFNANIIDGACASAWFSNLYTHCDFGDGVSGAISNKPGAPVGECCNETWERYKFYFFDLKWP